MMAELAAILPIVTRSSSLALELYRVAASSQDVTRDYIKVARAINGFASIVKQVGTLIKEDDRLPSHEAHETLENIIEQSGSIFMEIGSITSIRPDTEDGPGFVQNGQPQRDSTIVTRLDYLTAHLEALKTTLSVLLQTLYTAQSIMWSKLRPTVSPQQAARAVANEKMQLEALIIEQQISILFTSILYEQAPRSDARMLMETDSSKSLTAPGLESTTPNPADLHRYHDTYLASLDKVGSIEGEYISAASSVSVPQVECLLGRWTSLPQFDDRIRDAEQEIRLQRRQSQQPLVESDSEEERNRKNTGPQRPGSVQPLFIDTTTPPNPVPKPKFGPAFPLSPACSPKTLRKDFVAPINEQCGPVSPPSSVSSLPVESAAAAEATAAVEAKEEDSELELEIPWKLCTHKYYWKYIDGKMISSNTDMPPSTAFSERHAWTEIMASWACKEAINEAGYITTQVQKDRREGRKTKFETCFCIEQPLKFEQVKQLVERTVEIYRSTQPLNLPLRKASRSSFERPPPQRANTLDRERTPKPYAKLERTTSSMAFSPQQPPPLDRSLSMPGPRAPPHDSNPYLPTSNPYSHQHPQSPYPPPPTAPPPRQYSYPPPYISSHRQPHPPFPMPQPPLRQSHPNPHPSKRYDTDITSTDSDSAGRNRSRRYRSKSKSRYGSGRKLRTSEALSALMGVGGLTALLDGL